MRFEIVILAVALLLMANIYTEGRLITYLATKKKYFQIAGVAIAALFFVWLFRRNPTRAQSLIQSTNEYIKYLPLDRSTSSMVVDFTNKFGHSADDAVNPNTVKKKRSVSETKKKWVASHQNWRCGECGKQLPAWFEVDHKVRLEHGGSNHVDNLVALCRDCHGMKTAMENL